MSLLGFPEHGDAHGGSGFTELLDGDSRMELFVFCCFCFYNRQTTPESAMGLAPYRLSKDDGPADVLNVSW